MKTLKVSALRDPKYIVRGLLEKTKLLEQEWHAGFSKIWEVSCRTGKLPYIQIHLQDNGIALLKKQTRPLGEEG